MELVTIRTVAEIVSANYKTADVFKRYGIDFCCGGGQSLSEVCKKKNLNFHDIERELDQVNTTISPVDDFSKWELDVLIAYIVEVHHKYVRDHIPFIIQYSDKVAKVHGSNYPETVELNRNFHIIAEELDTHMFKEENILFPSIVALVKRSRDHSSEPGPPRVGIRMPIDMMKAEHYFVSGLLKNVAELSNNYTPPLAACTTYRVLYAKLREFESDLTQHIHLENNILFPRAIKLSKEVAD